MGTNVLFSRHWRVAGRKSGNQKEPAHTDDGAGYLQVIQPEKKGLL